MPKQRHHHPVILNAKVDRIREWFGENSAELFVNQPMGSCETEDFRQLRSESSHKTTAQITPTYSIMPGSSIVDIIPDFWKNADLFHPCLALTSASNCSSVRAREGSRSNRAQRESSSRFSGSLTCGSFMDSPMDCHSASTSSSFSPTGSAWSLRSSLSLMAEVSRPAAILQPLSHPIDTAL